MDEIAGFALLCRLLRPIGEFGLSFPGGVLDAGDSEFFFESTIVFPVRVAGDIPAGNEGDLIPKIGDLVVDRGGGEQEDFGFLALLDDIFQQSLVSGAPGCAVFLRFADGVVAEIVRLIDDDEAVIVPIEIREVVIAGESGGAGKIRVGEHVEAKPIFQQRIESAVGFEDRPVRPEFFRAENQDAFVAQFEVFDDGEGLEGFAQAHTVGKDAAIVFQQLVDHAFGSVALERIEHFPDLRFQQRGAFQRVIDILGAFEFIAEKMEESEEIDELRGIRRG